MTTHPTDAEIAEIASQKAFSDHDQLRRTLNVVEGTPEDATDPVVLIDRNERDRLCAAARDRNRLEAEMGSLSIVAGIRGDLCVAERKRCEKLEAENAKLREVLAASAAPFDSGPCTITQAYMAALDELRRRIQLAADATSQLETDNG